MATCPKCGEYLALAPYKDDEVRVIHLPDGKHTYKLVRKRP